MQVQAQNIQTSNDCVKLYPPEGRPPNGDLCISFDDPDRFIPSKVEVLTGLDLVTSAGSTISSWRVDTSVRNRENRTLIITGNVVVGNADNVTAGNLVAGGSGNTATGIGSNAVILGGQDNTANSPSSLILGGSENRIS